MEGGDRLDGVGATDRLHSRFRKAEVLNLAFLDQVFHRPRYIFNRHVRIDAVLIEQVDDIDLEPLERGLRNLLDVLRPAVHADPPGSPVWIELEAELGGNHHFPAEGSKGFTHQFLVGERAVDFGGIKECDSEFHGRPNQRNHFLLVFSRTLAKAHSHAAEPESRDFQIAFSKFAFFHRFSI